MDLATFSHWRKKQKLALIVLLFTISLTACTAGSPADDASGSAAVPTPFTGTYQESFVVEEGAPCVIRVTVTPVRGQVRIRIQEENHPENTVYEGNTFPQDPFTVTVRQPGRYWIDVHAENYVGEYHFTYNVDTHS